MKTQNIIIGILIVIIAVLLYLWLGNSGNSTEMTMNNGSKQATQKDKKVLYWRAPMNPNEVYDHPGKSKMGIGALPVQARWP